MPDAKERAMEYNLFSFIFLCRKLDVTPVALASMLIGDEPSLKDMSMDDHNGCMEVIKSFIHSEDRLGD